MENDIYTIQQLEEQSGVSRRTIRFYITRELLPPPKGSKRGSYYTPEHLEALKRIRGLVEEGYPLIQVKGILGSVEEDVQVTPTKSVPSSFQKDIMERYTLAPGVELHAKVGKISESCLEKILELLQEEGVLSQLKNQNKKQT
jgi:DNA-binding transcriptional MerR regulator